MYVYNIEECAEQGHSNDDADCDGNGGSESVDYDAEHDAKPASFAEPDCEPES